MAPATNRSINNPWTASMWDWQWPSLRRYSFTNLGTHLGDRKTGPGLAAGVAGLRPGRAPALTQDCAKRGNLSRDP